MKCTIAEISKVRDAPSETTLTTTPTMRTVTTLSLCALGLVAGDPCPNNELLSAGLEKGYAVYDDTMGRRADVMSLFNNKP